MKKLKVMLFVVALVSAVSSWACSMSVDVNYAKNQLMAHGVSYNELSLSTVQNLTISNFQKSFIGDDGGGACPDYLVFSGRIAMESPTVGSKSCSYAVTVTVKAYIGSDLPDGPFEDVTFTNAEAACSISGSIRRPVRVRRPINIPRPPR